MWPRRNGERRSRSRLRLRRRRNIRRRWFSGCMNVNIAVNKKIRAYSGTAFISAMWKRHA